MHPDDRPIHFSTELIHVPKSHPLARVQKLYYELSKTRHGNYLGTDFSPGTPPRFISRRGKKTKSLAVLLPDRILIAEEWVDIPLAVFLEKVATVAEHAITELELPGFVAQTVTIRTTFALNHYEDARAYLFERMCRLNGKIAPYMDRPIGIGGLRMVMPETPDHPGALNVTIESFRFSRNEVFVEVKGIFGHPISPEELQTLHENIRVVRDFIGNNVYPFLAQFDVPQQEPR